MSDQVSPIADELRRANARMTENERALGNALLKLAEDAYVAIEFLRRLTDPEAVDYDVGHALVAEESIRILYEAGREACGAQMAVVAGILRPAVH